MSEQVSFFNSKKENSKKIVEYSSLGNKKVKDSNNDNKKLDKFYTNVDIAEEVLALAMDFLARYDYSFGDFKILEPSAGNGAFIDALNSKGLKNDFLAYDIEPENDSIIKMDFLQTPVIKDNFLVVGNPPFGYKAHLAISFINRSADWGDIVVFILPIQFRRYNVQKRIRQDLKLVLSSDNLPKNSFNFEQKKFNVNSMIQIWVKSDNCNFKDAEDLRLKSAPSRSHEDFDLFIHNNTKATLKYFDKSQYNWDFAVHRQGFYDYTLKITDPNLLEKHKQYLFIKYKDEISKTIINLMDFEILSQTNTSIPGFSNTDFVREYVKLKEEYLKKNN